MSVRWTKEGREKYAKEFQVDLTPWPVIDESIRENNIVGKLPTLRPRLAEGKTNKDLAKEWGVTPRMASRIRNHQRPFPNLPPKVE